jgi:hypothetical protein
MRLGDTWGSLRSPLGMFSFAEIKEIVGAAGLPVHELGGLQQGSGGASKGQLLDAIDTLFTKKSSDDQDRIVVNCIREMVNLQKMENRRGNSPEMLAEFVEKISELLGRVGWGLTADSEPYPLSLQIGVDTATLDASLRDAINKCLRRFRDGDPDGALTAICGAVDTLTAQVFSQNSSLGDHSKVPYAVRVRSAFRTCEAEFKRQFSSVPSFTEDEINQLWDRQFKSIEQAGEVLAKLRQLSDAHGAQKPPPTAVQHAIDCAVYIVRIFVGIRV